MKRSLTKPGSSVEKNRLGAKLIKAIRSEDFNAYDKIVELVKKGADVNYVSPDGQTPLGVAIDMQWHAGVSLLLENGAEPRPKDPDDESPFEHACRRCSKDIQILETLVAFGAEVNSQRGYPEVSALHEAVSEYRLEVLKFILERGGNVDVVNRAGETPFKTACQSLLVGADKIVEVMLPYVKTLDIKGLLTANRRGAYSWGATNKMLELELETREAFAPLRSNQGSGSLRLQNGELYYKAILEKEVMLVIQEIAERQTGFAAVAKTVGDRLNQKTIIADLGEDWRIRAVVGGDQAVITASCKNIYTNLPTGEPALVKIKGKAGGTFVAEKRFYSNGLLWDPDANTPAVRIFNPDGTVEAQASHVRGIQM